MCELQYIDGQISVSFSFISLSKYSFLFHIAILQTELSQALTSLSEKAKSAKDFLVHLKGTIDQVQVRHPRLGVEWKL